MKAASSCDGLEFCRAVCLWKLTQQGLQGSGALGEPLPWVALGEKHAAGDAVSRRFKPEADAHEQVLPPGHVADLVLDGLLCGIHGVAVPTMDPLQRLLHLRKQENTRSTHRLVAHVREYVIHSQIVLFTRIQQDRLMDSCNESYVKYNSLKMFLNNSPGEESP